MRTKKISLSKFAKKLGVSRSAVAKAIEVRRIPASLVGELELSTGRRVPAILDPVAAAREFRGEGGLELIVSNHYPATHGPTAAESHTTDGPAVADWAGNTPAGVSRRTWDADEITQMVWEEYDFARDALMAIPASVAESLAACADAKQIQTILEGAIQDALDDRTADIDLYYSDDISDIEIDEPTALTEEKP